MNLDEYVLAYRALSRCSELAPELRARARHLYVCLALDLPSAIDARRRLLAEVQHKQLHACGPNVPELFEAKLQEKLATYSVPECSSNEQLKSLLQVLLDLTEWFVEVGNPGFTIRDPFCRCDCNRRNMSIPSSGLFFYRYVSLNVLEKNILFPGKAGTLPVTVQNRREFYSRARIELLARTPSLVGLERDHRISLAKPPEAVNGKKVQKVVFLVTSDSAPHKASADAMEIASRLGLPEYMDEETERTNEGFAVLKFIPAADDPLYRPTIIDALEHLAFRPGPPDNGDDRLFRHGWTRVFRSGELRGEEATISDELGCKEVIMPSRSERFPSAVLELETVCFFES